jgi:Zn-dependent protease
MAPTNQGSIRLGRIFGIDLYLHWSWFIIALIEIQWRAGGYTSLAWNVLEYLALFLIVLLHEFGHSLACRQVGGRANRIVLWPLGGVAYVDPPQRPGAVLWSIVAGPLVNVALAPVLYALGRLAWASGIFEAYPDVFGLWRSISIINFVLLIFNVLPIYPLDGGKILWSLLWFVFGQAWGLMIATIIGFFGVAALALLALALRSYWIGIIATFVLFSCWSGLRQAALLMRLARRPRRQGSACPACGKAPPVGALWTCGRCRQRFDVFENQGACPHCGVIFDVTRCLDCGKDNSIAGWTPAPKPPPPTPLPALPE